MSPKNSDRSTNERSSLGIGLNEDFTTNSGEAERGLKCIAFSLYIPLYLSPPAALLQLLRPHGGCLRRLRP